MLIRFQTFEQYHAKRDVGSTKIRVHNLINFWPEAKLYRYGENPDVLIFQKVFLTMDYRLPKLFENTKILDVCDPEWRDSPDIFIKETLDCMDGVVTSSDNMTEFLAQMTDTPIRTIRDRFDLSQFPPPRHHTERIKTVGWFGYSHNTEVLKFAIPAIEKRGLKLLIISNDDPAVWRYADDPDKFQQNYTYKKYTTDYEARKKLQAADVCVFPMSNRPLDRFKSENRTVVSELCGVPVVRDAEELDAMMEPTARENYIEKVYNKLKLDYDIKVSVAEYKDFINELRS